jgi:hypothetical protein
MDEVSGVDKRFHFVHYRYCSYFATLLSCFDWTGQDAPMFVVNIRRQNCYVAIISRMEEVSEVGCFHQVRQITSIPFKL